MNIKFGRKAPRPGLRKLRLANYLKAADLPAPPAFINWTKKGRAGLRDILANDQLGDCTAAGMMHIEDIWRAESAVDPDGTRHTWTPTTRDEAIWFYSATTGYVPGDPATDQGGDEATVLAYAKAKGIFADGSGKIAGYVAVDGSNAREWKTALWLFGNLYFGVALPDAWVNPFPKGDNFTWDVAGPANPMQGHCFVAGGYNRENAAIIDTWGMMGAITSDAIAKYTAPAASGELWTLLSPDWINRASQRAPNGIDFASLTADLAAIGQ